MRAPWITRITIGVLAMGLCIAAAPRSAAPTVDPQLKALLKKAAYETDSFHDRFDAEVWLADMSRRLANKVPYPEYRVELLKNVHYEAKRAGVEPELVLALIEVESNFNSYAISSAGARGLMQVMPFWLKEIGKKGDSLFRMQTNLRYGCTILKYYLKKEHGNIPRALALYNGSAGSRVYSERVYKAYYARWQPN